MRRGSRRTDHLVDQAGDLAWMLDPARPPACRAPPDVSTRELNEHAARWEATGGGKMTIGDWARILEARAVCLRCPVRAPCLLYALDPDRRVEGVWGGEYFPASAVRSRLDPDGWRVPVHRPTRERRRPPATSPRPGAFGLPLRRRGPPTRPPGPGQLYFR
jgi:hypothetical protein